MFSCSGFTISSATMIGAQTGGSICQAIGIVVLVSVILFVLFLFFVLFRYVRPSSAHRKVVWSKSEGWETAVLDHAREDGLEGSVPSPSRLKRAVTAMASSLDSSWIDRWLPLFEDYKGSGGRWLGLIPALIMSVAVGIILGFGVPLGSCTMEQVRHGLFCRPQSFVDLSHVAIGSRWHC